MFKKRHATLIAGIAFSCLLLGTFASAWQRGWGGRRGGWGREYGGDPRKGVPIWDHDQDFEQDAFTFARVIYSSGGGGYGWRGGWATDYPDSDLNFSLRLQQLTSLKVNPEPVQLELTDPRIFDYPFLYMIEVGGIYLSPDEIAAMRTYCLNGGFIMVDDFWGDYALNGFLRYMKEVFPEFEPEEVPLEHEIFNCVYELKEKPQVPSMRHWQSTGETFERNHDGDTRTPHYISISDKEGRVMVLMCHNTDLGDGWEREGEDRGYFEEFAVKKSYPLGINIVTYAMTH